MAVVYILYSPLIDHFYIGSTLDYQQRINDHNLDQLPKAFTHQTSDWELFLLIENLSYEQERLIEKHIKSMKSRRYIENLKRYPEMVGKLIERFSER